MIDSKFIPKTATKMVVKTGKGEDQIRLEGEYKSLIKAGPGIDVIEAGKGNNRVHAGPGDDIISAGGGQNIFVGGPGRDTFKINGELLVRGKITYQIQDFQLDKDLLSLTPDMDESQLLIKKGELFYADHSLGFIA